MDFIKVFCIQNDLYFTKFLFSYLLNNGIKAEIFIIKKDSYIYVSKKDYKKTVDLGLDYINSFEKTNILWNDLENVTIPTSFIPFMSIILPLGANIESGKNMDKISNYLDDLSDFLGKDLIVGTYNNQVTVYYKGSQVEYEPIISIVGKINTFSNVPFKYVFYPTKYNEIYVDNKKIENELTSNLKTFFDNSFALKEVISTSKKENKNYLSEFNTTCTNTISNLLNNNNRLIEGSFKINEHINVFDKQKVIINNGYFKTLIDVSIDEVTLTTILNKSNINDEFSLFNKELNRYFKLIDGVYVCSEHYKIMESNDKLLHYLDTSDFFEIYDINKKYLIDDGLIYSNVKKFNDKTFDFADKNIDEVMRILKK